MNTADNDKNPTVGELIDLLSQYDRDKYVALAIPATQNASEFVDDGLLPVLFVFDDLYSGEGDHALVSAFSDVVLVPLGDIDIAGVDQMTDGLL